MEYAIKLVYKGSVYQSAWDSPTRKELDVIKETITKAVSGKLEHLTFKNEKYKYYFGKKILKKSIITIVKK